MKKTVCLISFLFFISLAIKPAWAIVPPPILINVGVSIFEILAVLFSVLLQTFLVIIGVKKGRKFQVKGIHLLFVVLLLFVVFFLYINTYKILIRDEYNHLTANLFRMPEDDYYVPPGCPLVFGPDKDSGRLEDPFKPSSYGVMMEDVTDRIYSPEAVFIDIREPREYMACTIKGAVNIPEKELAAGLEKYRDKEIYLFGTGDVKSSQKARKFRNLGYNTHYMARGIKWFAFLGSGFFLYDNDGNDITMIPRFFDANEREKWNIPPGPLSANDYKAFDEKIFYLKNTHKLLATDEIKKDLHNGGIILVDVRPGTAPHEYLNLIPVSNLTIPEIEKKRDELPADKGIVIVCDDFFTAFEAQWLGCELVRRGFDYRGRYTNPQEFFLPPPQMIVPFYFTFERFAEYVYFAYQHLQFYIGNTFNLIPGRNPVLLYGFLAFILCLRIALLPLSLFAGIHKAKVMNILNEKLNSGSLKPMSMTAWITYLNGIEKINPFTKILFIIPDLIIITLALITGFYINERGWFLAPVIMNADSPSVWAALISSCLFYINELQNPLYFRIEREKNLTSPILPVPLIFALIFFAFGVLFLPAVFTAFLGINYLISIIEYMFASIVLKVRDKKDRAKFETESVIPITSDESKGKSYFSTPGLYKIGETFSPLTAGRKAYNLSVAEDESFSVPSGFVISSEFFDKYPLTEGKLTGKAGEELLKAWNRFKFDTAIVRSSAGREDGSHKSYAGIFESVPDVTAENFLSAVEQVYSSYTHQRAALYDSGNGEFPLPGISGGIIVQEMLHPDFSGILFTVDPQDPAVMSLDIFTGRIGNEIFERETPLRLQAGRISGEILNLSSEDERIKGIPLKEIIEGGRRLEEIFKNPQDMEWAVKNGRFYILQSRNIVYSDPLGNPVIAAEKKRLLNKLSGFAGGSFDPEAVIWKFNEVSEVLPFPSPSSLSLFRKMWEPEGPVDTAYQSFGIPYNSGVNPCDILETVFGRLYVNEIKENELRLKNDPAGRISALYGKISIEFQMKSLHKSIFFTTKEYIDGLIIQIENLTSPDGLFAEGSRCLENLLKEHLIEVFRVNIMLNYCAGLLEKELAGTGLAINNLSRFKIMKTPSEPSPFPHISGHGKTDPDGILSRFSHRAPEDYELSCPRFGEEPALLKSFIGNCDKNNGNNGQNPSEGREELRNYLKNKGFKASKFKKITACLENISVYSALKERGRDITAGYIALLRKILLKLDDLYQTGGNIFYLTIDEIWSLRNNGVTWDIKALINKRLKERECFLPIELPLTLSLKDLEKAGIEEVCPPPAADSVLKGIRVSGSNPAKGSALIASRLEEAANAAKNHILIIRNASPQWSVVLPFIGGIVSEGGGMLSHLAILAREYGVPYTAGCREAVSRISNGDGLTLQIDGTVTVEKCIKAEKTHEK